jgi:hypothetical protein
MKIEFLATVAARRGRYLPRSPDEARTGRAHAEPNGRVVASRASASWLPGPRQQVDHRQHDRGGIV